MTERFGLALNLARNAASQYTNLPFNSMCVFNGKPLAASESGIFSMDDAETDNSADINSVVEFPTTDFGYLRAKRFRKMYVGYETSGSIKITVKPDGGAEESFTLTADKTGQIQHRGTLSMSRSNKGVYWVIKLENENGCDFSIDHIEGLPIILTKGRR